MKLRPVADLASDLALAPEHVHAWGPHRAKVDLGALERPGAVDGPPRLILVSALNPTPAGEGKTVTSIGLAQGLRRTGRQVCLALREPSMGPVFGIKGGGTGGGRSCVEPSVDINLHFTGDLHAVTAAHNLLAAAIDHALHFRTAAGLDARSVSWPRVLDVGDRALRQVVTGLGGNGAVREGGFDITAASEVMAALCMASGEADLRDRLGRLLCGFTPDREPVYARDLGVVGAMTALLQHALWPNLVQTTEGVPALVHGGPFANIAHGCNSVVASRLALHQAPWVVTEAGFGFDLGAQKFLSLVAPSLPVAPAAGVVVATVRALRWHGGVGKRALDQPNPGAVERGLANLDQHLDAAAAVGLPVVVSINGRPDDTDDEVQRVVAHCAARGVAAVPSTYFTRGGKGATALAHAVAEIATGPAELRMPDAGAEGFEARLAALSRVFHGSDGVRLSPRARAVLRRAEAMGLGDLPPCIAKTQYSLSDDPSKRGRPTGWTLEVQDLKINPGAGFLVALAGDINRMPALPRSPSFVEMDLVEGSITGV